MRSWNRLTRHNTSRVSLTLLAGGAGLWLACASPASKPTPAPTPTPPETEVPELASGLPTFAGSLQYQTPSYLSPSWYCRLIRPGAPNTQQLKGALLDKAQQDSRWAARTMDVFAWNTFLAVNWPLAAAQSTGSTYQPQWAAYARKDELPQVFDPSAQRPWRCEGTCLSTDLPGEGVSTDKTEPLTDPRGNPVYFELRANPTTGKVINTYWKAGVTQPTVVTFQNGQCKSGGDQYDLAPAVEMKMAWKVLVPGKDDAQRYFTLEKVRLPGASRTVDLGLVSMHIAAKVKTRDWIAMTFEHVDNVPLDASADERKRAWSFYDPGCVTGADRQPCPTNVPLTGGPEQLTRTVAVGADTQALNQEVHQWLQGQQGIWKGWRNYQLIGSQEMNPTSRTPTPAVLRNAIIEAYLPSPSFAATLAVDSRPKASSCLGCHARSHGQDFSFLIGDVLKW